MRNNHFAMQEYNDAYQNECGKAAILHYPPLWVTLGIISACTYQCAYCAYHSPDARGISKVYNVKFTMPLEEAKNIIDFIHAGGVPHIHVCATGEPLLHKDFFAIIDHVITRYGKVSFQSNFSRKLVQKYDAIHNIFKRQQYISYITTDMMGNDTIKGGGNREELYETLAQLSTTNIPLLKGQFLLTKINYMDLETVVRDVHKHKLRVKLSAAPVFPHNINDFTAAENAWRADDKELARSVAEINELARSLGVSLSISPPPCSHNSPDCAAFWKKFQLWPTAGSVTGRNDNIIPHACNAVVLGQMASFGYLFDYPDILSAWNSDLFVKVRQSLLQGIAPDTECRDCPYANNLMVKNV